MGAREASWTLDTGQGPTGLRKLRDEARAALASWCLAEELVDDTVTIVSELVANALTHAPPGPVTLTLRAAGRCLGGEVCDSGPPFKVPEPRQQDDYPYIAPDAESGRGLNIVAALTTGMGVDPAGGAQCGKSVWFTRCW